ncbi:MAG: protease HtpX [Oceanococcus sp.]
MKRVLLFTATNIAVLVVLSIVANLFGVDRFLTQNGLNMPAMLIFCAIFGMGGSFISLAISKPMAKWSTKAQIIDKPSTSAEAWLLSTVQRQARQANIGMPEVAIYNSADVNAFATGMNKNNALVAVSTGLLQGMTQDEIEAVLGHEISHVANGDMVTLTLVQGVVNTFVMFLARVVGYAIDKVVFKSERAGGPGYFISVLVLQIVFGILASAVVAWFSRYREFHADAGGAHLAGRRKMIAALERLKNRQPVQGGELPEQLSAFGVAPNFGGGFKRMFSTHPPLDERIAALKNLDNPIS